MTPPDRLEDVDLTHPLAGSEGVDPNHASRIRIQTLLGQHSLLITQTQFADAKSAALVTLVSLLVLSGLIPADALGNADPFALLSGIASSLAILFSVMAVFPRYPGKAVREHLPEFDRFSWPALTASGLPPESYARYMQTAEVSQIVHSIAYSNCAVSRILLRKYQMLRISILFGTAYLIMAFARLAGAA